jgi:hypothetical protein
MRTAGNVARVERRKTHGKFWWEKPEEELLG